jgi:acyl-CoA thioester hydrolase
MSEPMVLHSKQYVYFDMMDPLHHLHNAEYLVLFERARFELWRALGEGAYPENPDLDWPYVVARNEINYRAPVEHIQPVDIFVTVSHLGNSSLTLSFKMYREDGELAAEGLTVIVRVDPQTRRPRPWSEKFRSLIAPYCTDAKDA